MTALLEPVRVDACRGCGTRFSFVNLLQFGDVPVLRFDPPGCDPAPIAPLNLMGCQRCGLVQLTHNAPPAWLYSEYWYRSGVNESMVTELRDIVRRATELVDLRTADTVIDIGANDGTLLAQYSHYGFTDVTRVAYEPAQNLFDTVGQHARVVIQDYFPSAVPVVSTGGARIITSIAMLYDLPDIGAFLTGIKTALAADGVWIAEFQDLYHLVLRNGWDMICHEHLELYTLTALAALCTAHGLVVVDCEHRAINGGSLRIVVQHAPPTIAMRPSVAAYLAAEARLGLTTPAGLVETFRLLRARINLTRLHTLALLDAAADRGQVVDLYGASTKGHTLLHVLGVTHDRVRQALERSPEKWGRVYGSSGIPIVSEDEGRLDPAPLWLSVIWQFAANVVKREARYLEQGGAIIFPLPTVEVVTHG